MIAGVAMIGDLLKMDLGDTDPLPTSVLFVSGSATTNITKRVLEPIARNQNIAL